MDCACVYTVPYAAILVWGVGGGGKVPCDEWKALNKKVFTFWGTRLPAFSSLQPLLDLGVYVEYILLLSRWGWIRRTLNTAPQRQNGVCSQLFCLLVHRVKTVALSTGREHGWSANPTFLAEEDTGQANIAAVHIYFYVNKCIYKYVSALGFLLNWQLILAVKMLRSSGFGWIWFTFKTALSCMHRITPQGSQPHWNKVLEQCCK